MLIHTEIKTKPLYGQIDEYSHSQIMSEEYIINSQLNDELIRKIDSMIILVKEDNKYYKQCIVLNRHQYIQIQNILHTYLPFDVSEKLRKILLDEF